jgi:WD40 repeat protein
MRRSSIFLLVFIMIQLMILPNTDAQSPIFNERFGKSRVQKRKFKWQYISTQNFDVYFFDGGRDLANYAARYAEQNFDKMCRVVGFSPYHKVKLIIYNSVADAQQSNIGIEDPDIEVGGYTNFVKSRIEVPFRGSRTQFNKDIDQGIADVIINVMMYGGNLKDVVQSSFLLALPDWFLAGASRYISEGWSIEMDDYMRDLVKKNKIKKPSSMEGRQAHLVGQSIWNYIAKKYGEENMGNILNLTRIMRDEKESIENTLGIPYNALLADWQDYYRNMSEKINDQYVEPPHKSFRVRKNKKKHFDFRNLSISPDGTRLAYSQTYKGKYKINVSDTAGNNRKVILRGGFKLVNQPENKNIPLVAWQSNTRVAIVTAKINEAYLNFYTFSDRKFYEFYKKRRVKIILDDVKEVLSMDFSADGKFIVMSAVRRGQSDIYIYDVYSDKLIQITNDVYDDLHPKFEPNSQAIVFSSNRYIDTINKPRDRIFSAKNKFNILRFIPTDSVRRFEKYTKEGNNFLPQKVSDGILYLSDQTGIMNLYKVSNEGATVNQITNYANNISYYHFNQLNNILAFKMLHKGRENIYSISNFDHQKYIAPSIDTDREIFLSRKNSGKKSIKIVQADTTGEDLIDINSFQFETDKKKRKKNKAQEKKVEPPVAEFMSTGPYLAKPLMSFDKLLSTLKIDPLRGFGIYLDGGVSDQLGNHKLSGGAFLVTNLSSNSVFAEYQYLKHRIDYRARYDRSSFDLINSDTAQHFYAINTFAVSASLPFTTFDRISFSPFVTHTRYNDVPTQSTFASSLFARDSSKLYTGFKLEYVHDDVEITGMNMMVGTRFKMGYEQYIRPLKSFSNFGKFYLDFRHYQRIHKEIVLATRASGGAFVGNAPKNFFLGGMDNWLFNRFKTHGEGDPLNITPSTENSDILFSPFMTNIRGFDYNAAFGPKYLLFNVELRVPLIRYLYNGPITSNFFRNLQFTVFNDLGAAWSGVSPFNQNNNLNTVNITNNNNFDATVVNYISPWLYGYGAGLRTLFLGYYSKLDVAWGVLNYTVQSPKVYLTIGYDF